MTNLVAIHPEVIDQKVIVLIADACHYSNGKYAASDLITLIVQGKMQLWGSVDDKELTAICITEVAEYPQAKVLRFLCATGKDAGIMIEHMDKIEAWGKSVGCVRSEPVCRPGWKRLLKGRGYTETHVLMDKEL